MATDPARVALVTGASSGIGEETARGLAQAGFTTYGAARRVDRMAGLAAEGVHVFGMDVTDDASMVAGVERILAEQGRIDVLVNNAGYGSYGAVEDVPITEARRQFEVNLFGLARLIQLVLPGMRERGSGRIVNVSSIGAVIYEPFGAWYHATKNAVEGFSDSLRVEVAPFGVDVVIIRPAGVVTEWNTISREGLLATARGGAYERNAGSAAAMLESVDNPRLSSPPSTVARTIVKAATARRPRTRYPTGRFARSLIGARRALPDKAYDAIVTRAYLRERWLNR
jgi:NAD(P)-dependent dehydrogenase (short-subunit alcohol dehydrogenase family)